MLKRSLDKQVYEYIYTRKQYRNTLKWCVIAWLSILVLRTTAYVIFGSLFVFSVYNLATIGISGILVGIFIQTVRTIKHSNRIGEVDVNTGSISIDSAAESAEDEDRGEEEIPDMGDSRGH